MKHTGCLLILLVVVLAACSMSGGTEPGAVILSPTPRLTAAALRPATPAATGDATTPDEAATPTPSADASPTAAVDPYQDEATMLVYSQLEEDSSALIEFMQSDPARRAMYGGTYIEHPTGPQLGAPDSINVLQLVATQAEADALRAELPPLNFPDRLQIELVICTDDHLNELMEQRRPALDASGIWIGQFLHTKANRVGLMVKASPDYVVVGGLIDKSTLPPDIAVELDDPCITVSQGTDTIVAGDDPLDGTNWQLVSAPGYEATVERLSPDLVPTLAFSDGAFVFTTGCNNPGGNYVVRGSRLEVSAVRTTTMLCSSNVDDPAPKVESALATIASTLESYSISGDELRLGYPGGELLLNRLSE